MLKYDSLSRELTERIKEDRCLGNAPDLAFDESGVLRRRDVEKDRPTVLRTAFIHDIDKILHCPYYNRYADKTQVFSFCRNDDVTRRALHVQLVSRIARTLGKTLCLNLDLIEAISLGHDIGHTPFGHAGEKFLDELFYEHAERHFSHNVHSVRVLDRIYPYNISLQTLSGIASHDGEMELSEYHPSPLTDFSRFDELIESCYRDKNEVKRLIPSTLEGCVMRISDIIAYLGKDRQDAERMGILDNAAFAGGAIGTYNAEILNNLMVNIVENSYGKPYIKMDPLYFDALKEAKNENYQNIYLTSAVAEKLSTTVRPMMREVYEKLLSDLKASNTSSPIFTHHLEYVKAAHYTREIPYEETEQNQLVVDYIASMTDDYFLDLHAYLFPKSSHKVEYVGYFQ